MARTAHEHGWLRAAEHLAQGRQRSLAMAMGPQAASFAVFAVAGLAALPGRAAWQDLLAAAAFAWSAWATWTVTAGRTDRDAYAVALLGAIVGLAVAGLVGSPGGPLATGLPFAVLLATAAPHLRRLAVAALGSACAAAHLGLLVLTGRPGVGESWLMLVVTLGLVVALASTARADHGLLRQLVDLEARDPVTGLPNDRYVGQAAEHAFATATRQAPLAVLAVELDGRRELDHAHGVRTGDQVLAAVARRLRRKLRDDDVIARVDDDVIVVLLPGLDETLAWDVACGLRTRAAEPLGRLPGVTLSVGLAVHPATDLLAPAEPSAPRLLALAREALAQAKDAGGDRVEVAGRAGAAGSGVDVAQAAYR